MALGVIYKIKVSRCKAATLLDNPGKCSNNDSVDLFF